MFKIMLMYTSKSSSTPKVVEPFQSFRKAVKLQRWFKDKHPNATVKYVYFKKYTVKIFANKTDRFPRIIEPVKSFNSVHNIDKYIAMFPNGRIIFEVE